MLKISNAILGGILITVGLFAPVKAQVFYFSEDSNIKHAEKAIRSGDLVSASRYYHRAVRSGLGKERLLPTLNNICIIDYALKEYHQAENACSAAIREDRKFWQAYLNRGNVKRAMGDAYGAEDDYKRALRLNPHKKMAQQALDNLMAANKHLVAEVK